MAYYDLRQFISRLEEERLLCRLKPEVDWNLEAGAIRQKAFASRGPAVLFENVKDSPYPLLSGAMYTYRRYGLGIGTSGDLRAILQKALYATQHPIAPVSAPSGPCQEIVLTGSDIDLYKFPVPHWHE